MTAHGLIDTTEMYLRTVFELEEEGIVPLRARIAERLAQSGPTVSQTVARMERDGLLHVAGDRQLALTDAGRALATRVMRKHRLAECLLVSVIQLPWEEVHIEACRWEHVISESVERRLYELLGRPCRCPHGNLIPGLEELVTEVGLAPAAADSTMIDVTRGTSETVRATVTRITEHVQSDLDLMLKLKQAGIQPGREVLLGAVDGGIRVYDEDAAGGTSADLSAEVASHVFVSRE
ncbi:MAG TPA: iron dependent repressor, metal binding and dimerization domain protein [Trebonia sp.]|nr:iron dependent repressor, metal binding and dimerization domain protein [Trebonia sp.]